MASVDSPPRPLATAAPGRTLPGVLAGTAAMTCVGGSVAVSGLLGDAPLAAAQALRYGLACALLLLFARLLRQRVRLPRGADWAWLLGVTVSGLVVFNVALVEGARHAEPAAMGVAVAAVPVVLALVGPLLERRLPGRRVVLAAAVVTAGAVLVQGTGRTDATGVAWAVVVLACEAGFTLLAVPVLGRLGPWGVSVHTTWLAAVVFAVLALGGMDAGGSGGLPVLAIDDVLAVAYLAVAVTAVAFVLWYSSVRRLGAGAAGLLTGVAPVAAALTGVLLGGPAPRPLVWVGVAVVAAGLALGLVRPRRAPAPPGHG